MADRQRKGTYHFRTMTETDHSSHRDAMAARALAWIESAYDPVVCLDLDLVIRYANPAFGSLVGAEPGRCVGQAFIELAPLRTERDAVVATIRRAGIERFRQDAAYRTDDGVSELLFSARPDMDAADELVGYVVATRDVTAIRAVERALQRSEADFRTLAENSPDSIVRYGPDGRITYSNLRFGHRREGMIGRRPSESATFDPIEMAEYERLIERALATGEPGSVEVHVPGDGARVHNVQIRAERSSDGAIASVLTIGRDITELVLARESIAAKEREFRSLAENASDFIARWGTDGTVLYANPAFASIDGRPADVLIGSRSKWVDDPSYHEFGTVIRRLIATGRPETIEQHVIDPARGLGERVHEVRLVPEYDQLGRLVSVLGLGRDVTDVVRHRVELERLARTDMLTGIANRQVLYDQGPALLERSLADGRRVGMMLLDLDGFKHVNDRFGHRAGDELLRVVGARLRGCIRDADLLVRLGGDEFVIVVPDLADPAQMDDLVDRVRLSLTEMSALDGLRVARVDASIGVVLHPDDGTTVDVLLANADMAMYQAKRNGRGRVEYFRSALISALERRRTIEQSLLDCRFAADFELHLQPVFALDGSDTIVGAEALARWDHPELGPIPPAEFIPVAEECGRIVELGRWALLRAAELAVRYNRGRATPLRIAVNVSTRQFALDDVAAAVAAAVRATGCRPTWLTIEITESLLLEDSTSVQRALDAVRSTGVTVAIDDFGMGYSALHYLARFPVDHLKIDRSFVAGIGADDRRTELVRAFMALAQALGLSPIAEGIETVEQLAFLRSVGCRNGQGYLLARPAPPDDFERLLAGGSSPRERAHVTAR
jgi:diguanylate cyclase (GGDEF)-like protein/PAS domain S-box-containing protein